MRFENILFFVLLIPVFTQAQTGNAVEDSSIIKVAGMTIHIPGDGKLTYNYGRKIGDDPIFKDSVKVETSVEYNFLDKKVPSNFEVKTIKAPKIKMTEPLEKIYKRFVAIGINDFKSAPLFELSHTTIRNRKYNVGFEIQHISQNQTVGSPINARYGNSNVALYGKKFYDKKTLYGSFDYDHNLVNFHGFNENQFLIYDEKSLNRGLGKFNIETGFKSNYKDERFWGYDVNINYDEFSMDEMSVVEHRVNLAANINKYSELKNYDWFKGVFNLDFEASYLNSGNPLNNHESALFSLFPAFDLKLQDVDLKIGVKTFYQTIDPRKFTANVFAEADFGFVKDVLHIFARFQNDYKRLSYLDYAYENPFVANYGDILTQRTPIDFMGGAKGAFSSKSSFNFGFRYRYHTKLPLFYNISNDGLNEFVIVADKVDHRQGFLEFIHEGKKLDLLAKAEYNVYDVYKYEAFHLPNIYVETRASYKLKDKFVVGVDLFFYGSQLALDSFDSGNKAITSTLNPIFDFNIDVRYNYSEKLGGFLKTNNILNTKHVRWDQYANYGINFLIGLDYNF